MKKMQEHVAGNPPSGWVLHFINAPNNAGNLNIGCYRWLSHCTFCSHSYGIHPLSEVQVGEIYLQWHYKKG